MLTIVCGTKCILKVALCILKLAVISELEILKKFGDRVRQLRKQKDISQEELAHRADLHRTYIGMIERAEKNITLLNIEKIANALDVEVKKLVTFDELAK
jgi:ribosome-binding protein aMBF1 (putative translation factor)